MKKRPVSLTLVFIFLFSMLSMTSYAQSPKNAKNLITIGGYTIVIHDEELLSNSQEEITHIILDSMKQSQTNAFSGETKDAESEAHSCSPIGPYAYNYGGWNYVYDSNGNPSYKFRIKVCISSGCTYSQVQTAPF